MVDSILMRKRAPVKTSISSQDVPRRSSGNKRRHNTRYNKLRTSEEEGVDLTDSSDDDEEVYASNRVTSV